MDKVTVSTGWTLDERLDLIKRIVNSERHKTWKDNLVLALTCLPADMLELSRRNFEDWITDDGRVQGSF